MQTLVQFAAAMRRAYLDENPDLTGAEYDRYYDAESRLTDWYWALDDAMRAGEMASRVILDDVYHRFGAYTLSHFMRCYPASIPAGYLNPAARKWNREQEAAMRAARKAGRARAG